MWLSKWSIDNFVLMNGLYFGENGLEVWKIGEHLSADEKA